MKILFVAPYVPSRIRVRPFGLIHGLAERHDVSVVALGDSSESSEEDTASLSQLCTDFRMVPHSKLRGARHAICALPSRRPMCTSYCRSSEMHSAVEELLASSHFDVMHIEHLRAAHFAPGKSKLPVVFDSVDCLTDLFSQMSRSGRGSLRRLVMAEEAWKLRRYEPKTMKRFKRVLVTSEAEQMKLLRLNKNLDIEVIPNGVDTRYFAPQDVERKPARLIFCGKMGYMPNEQAVLWFAKNVMPLLRRRVPDAELVVVGKDPSSEVRKLADAEGITVTGYLDDVRAELAASTVAIAPMQIAVGIQNKVLEAMAMALPVVATPLVTAAFPPACPGIVEAGSAEEMVDRVISLIQNPAEARAFGQDGRRVVEEKYSWSASVQKLEKIYEEVCS